MTGAQKLSVLIIGGYGTFGRRLLDLLADDTRLKLIVAGRSLDKARAVCPGGGGAERVAAVFDRDGDLAEQMRRLGPDVVVDAAGPFQLYGANAYKLVEAALDAGAHYLDLADGREFVTGIADFHGRAEAARRFALSGASTFPALSGAVVRALSHDMEHVEHIEAGIAPSPRAGLGLSVIRAIASYAGKRIGGSSEGGGRFGLTDARRHVIMVSGTMPLPAMVFSQIDVPDLDLMRARQPNLASLSFSVSTRPQFFHTVLILAAWLVRLRLLPGLVWLARPMHFISRTMIWGDHRSGTFLSLAGRRMNSPLRRKWTIITDGDAGLNIPVIAAAIAIGRTVDGSPPAAGARAADQEFELSDYRPFFDRFGIRTAITEAGDTVSDAPLYRRLLGRSYQTLSPQVQAVHEFRGLQALSGMAKVTRGKGLLARLIAVIIGFPREGRDIPLKVTLSETASGELWRRSFDGQRFESTQFAGTGRSQGLLMERFGLLTFGLGLVTDGDRLRLVERNWNVLGLPLPRFLMPTLDAYEDSPDGRFNFHVSIKVPIAGLIVAYEGWLETEAAAEPRSGAT